MIKHHCFWNLWLKTYQEAVESGIHPREELQLLSKEVRESLSKESPQPQQE
jgi:hypothetical protein